MAKKRKNKLDNFDDYLILPDIDIHPDIKRGIVVISILTFGAVSLLSLFDLAGEAGAYLQKGLLLLFGWGRWIFPVILIVFGYQLYHKEKNKMKGANYFGLFLFVVSFQSLLHLLVAFMIDFPTTALSTNGPAMAAWRASVDQGIGGGYIGLFLSSVFLRLLGLWASLVIVIGLLLISLMLLFNTTLSGLIGGNSWFAKAIYFINYIFHKIFNKLFGQTDDEEEQEVDDGVEEVTETEETIEETTEEVDDGGFVQRKIKFPREKKEAKISSVDTEKPEEIKLKSTHVRIDLPLDLLENKSGKAMSGDINNNKAIIKRTLENFGIPIELGEVSIGPTVTQYTFKPDEGVKLSRITTLSNDLALALAAHPLRIEAPIPGKSLVGVEVPNQTKAVVGLKEILTSEQFKEKKSNMMVVLGKDVSGKPWVYDLTRMPHLLVAGQTNSGKSVCMNAVIVGLLYQNNPDDLRFIMVDLKRVELPSYNGIPHLLTPVITEVGKTLNALRWCLNEMDRRYDLFAKSGDKNIAGYNKRAPEKLPYIVFMIDELADLMMLAARDAEPCIIRLLQLARAAGIHLILATQRPSVDVVTGLIKANMPARVAFSVTSLVDSRTILDSAGAENLLGKGDMLFKTAEISKPVRLQGAFLSDSEINKVVRYIKENGGEAQYLGDVVEKQRVTGAAATGMDNTGFEDTDELLEEAKEMVINSGKASSSFLQRRLSIGYARAARLLDLLEEKGIVGPANGSKPREILITKEQYANIISQGTAGASLHKMEEAEAPESYLGGDESSAEEPGNDESEDTREEQIEEFEEEVETPEIEEEVEEAEEMPVHRELKPKSKTEKKEVEPDDFDDGKFFSR